MSRCVLDNDETGDEVVIGWDVSLGTFFAQVISRGAEEPSVWLGTRPGEFVEPDDLVQEIAYAAGPFDGEVLIENLLLDRETNSERIYSVLEASMNRKVGG